MDLKETTLSLNSVNVFVVLKFDEVWSTSSQTHYNPPIEQINVLKTQDNIVAFNSSEAIAKGICSELLEALCLHLFSASQ